MKDIIMSNYWVDRFTAEENRINELSKEQVKEAKKQYDIALKNTNQKIYEFYAKYAKDNNISMYEAKQRFNKKELKEFKMSLSEYIRKGQSLNISPDDSIIKELKNVSSRVHIERLEALKMEIKAEIDLLSKTMENNLDKHLREVYRDTYYRSAYNIQKGLDKFSNIEKLNPELLESLVYKPWTKDNTNWSKRIWGNDSKLVNTLHTNLTQNIITGKPLKDIIDIVEERFNVERNIATRLIMTESAAYHSRAKERCMKDLGCEKYEVIATLDDRTSPICRTMDGKIFDMKDYEVGVTASPFHSNCRSVTAPYYDKIEGDTNLRASRTEDNDYKLVDVKDYQDWYNNYVEKDELGLTLNQKYAIMRYIGDESYILNDNLRQGINLTNDQKQWVRELDKALKKVPIYKGEVTRSLSFFAKKEELKEFLNSHKLGDIKTYKAYTSVTSGDVYNPSGEVQLKIISKTGRDIREFNEWEQEILFERNKKFKIIGYEFRNGRHYLKMEELDE